MILTKENIQSIDLDNIIDQRIKNSNLKSFIIIVPTNRKSRSLKKEIISLAPNKVSKRINIETLSTLSRKILEQTVDFHNLTDEASAVFLSQSSQKIQLEYFTNYKNRIPQGTLDRIGNVISKYKEEGITPDLLKTEAAKLNKSENLKAYDIANIYEVFNQKCNSLNAYELGDIYSKLNDLSKKKFDSIFSSMFKDVDLVFINGFNEFTNLELSIIDKLSKVSGVKLFVNFDYYDYNSILFAHLKETYEKLNSFGFSRIGDDSEFTETKFHDIVRRKLFLKTHDKQDEGYRARIFYMSAESREKEIEYIAKEIKILLLNSKTQPHEICVTCNLINNYSSLVRDIFKVYGIPFNLTDRIYLDRALSVTAIINFLEIVESDYYYKSILRSMSNSFIEIEGFDLSSFLFSAKNLKILIGKDNWKTGLLNAIKTLELDPEYNDNVHKIESYKKALGGIKILDNLLSPFQKKMIPSKFIEELNKLIQILKIAPKLVANNYENQETDIKSFTTFLKSIDEIFTLVELEEQEKGHNLTFYLDKIRTLSQTARYNIKERSDYGVLVTNIDEIRGLRFKHTFLLGMIDGDFPTKYQPEIFLSGSFSKQEQHHLNRERYRFYQALNSWEKSLYLTYPLSDSDKETVRSTFLDEFSKVFRIIEKPVSNYSTKIFSEEELQRNIMNPNFPRAKIKDRNIGSSINEWQKAVEIDVQRNSDPFGNSIYSGRILSSKVDEKEEVKKKLEEVQSSVFSISQLETYLKCPFKYFLERILKVEIVEEPDEEIEAIEIGSLLHAILFEFYLEIRKREIVIKNCNDQVFKLAENLIFRIAEKYISGISKDSPYAFIEEENILGINSKKEDSLLYRFLLQERRDESDRSPQYFEVSFGVKDSLYDEKLHSRVPLDYEGIKLRGKIDRIDINNENKTYEVIDYKSGGNKVSNTDIEKGLSLQLPVYVWAVKTLLLNQFGEVYFPQAMTIYSLRYQERIFGKNPVSAGNSRSSSFDAEANINELVDTALKFVKQSVNSIQNGDFPLTPFYDNKDNICRYCNFSTICRVDELLKQS